MIYFHFSPVDAKEIIPHVYQFLIRKDSILSETTFTEFDDEFLVQNVKSISITDLDGNQCSNSNTQVIANHSSILTRVHFMHLGLKIFSMQ